jgi:hypothetical protein
MRLLATLKVDGRGHHTRVVLQRLDGLALCVRVGADISGRDAGGMGGYDGPGEGLNAGEGKLYRRVR